MWFLRSRFAVRGSDNVVVDTTKNDKNRNITTIARRLREVRRAQRQFLTLWALESLAAQPKVLDRVAHDIEKSPPDSPIYQADWSGLYRGSVLDD
jgi:hypothetical protein